MANILYAALHGLLSILIPTTNIVVIVVLSRLLKKSCGKSYVFILNLAAADLLVGLMCIVETVDDVYDEGFDNDLFFCLLRLCLTITPCVGSMLTLLLISLDRYLAVVLPLYYLKIMSTKSVLLLLVGLWMIAFFVGHVPLIYPSLQQTNYTAKCGLFYAAKNDYLYILCFSVFLPSLITLICLHITVGKIAYLHQQRIQKTWVRNSPMTAYPPNSSQFRAIRTVLIVIVCFTLSWGPYYIAGMVQAACPSCDLTELLTDLLFLLGETNSLLNPLIYTFYCRDIRSQMSKFITCKRRKVKPHGVSDLAIVNFTNIMHPPCLKKHINVTDLSQEPIPFVTPLNVSSDFSEAGL
ncbi:glucose-dependent insulinotropic receptor-like [Ambystoma mexicanum]|uniref:glucose-dependent insulinotropic receptor-like n=1 Tax=Ambystoma mexicanum TaxID=8296 RepID=UPI0037E8D8B8